MPQTSEPMNLTEFLRKQGLVGGQWDLLMFGDGSGKSWKEGGGFCTFLVDGRRGERAHIIGARNATTVNRMELSAYVEALSYHYFEVLRGKITQPPYRVWAFSDSEYTVKSGNRDQARSANLDLWTLTEWYEQRGYRLRWRWLPRNSNPLHETADRLCGEANRKISELVLSDEQLYRLLPDISTPTQVGATVELITCAECGLPMMPTEHKCAQCGRIVEGNE